MSGLHVLQLGPYPPPEGGISRNMLDIRDELIKGGNGCSIIATSKSSRVTAEPGVYHPRSAFAFIGLLRALKFDILHLHIGGDITPRLLALAFLCSLFGGKASVLTLHSGAYPQTEKGKSAKSRSIRGFVFRRFKSIIAVNSKIAGVFQRYGVAAERINTIYPFIHRRPDPGVKVPAEFEAFFDEHQPLLLSVGGLEPDYDVFMQIEALGEILKDLPDAGLMLVGDGSLRAEVEAAIAAVPYADKILVAGDVEHAVTLHLMDNADIFLRTTLFDGDAISVREALFLGTPVIASDNDMRPLGVHLIAIRDKAALLNAVRKIMSGGRRKENNARTDSKNVLAIIQVYEELTR